MKSSEMDYVGVVAKLQRDGGGSTAEVLEQVVGTVRSRQELSRMVRTLTAQGRLGGAVVTGMPLLVAAGMSVIQPGYMNPMLESPIGIVLLLTAGGLLLVGWTIISRIVDINP
jgi:tight adherence protein B